MSTGDLVTGAAAIGGLLTIIGNFVLQWKTLTISQQTSAKVDVNTARTDEAAAASQANSATLTGVIARVEQAKVLSAAVIQKVEGVEKSISAVHADVTNIAVDQAERVTDLTAQLKALK